MSIGEYSEKSGLSLEWVPGFFIQVRVDDASEVVLTANREGLVSLAQHLLTLAEDAVPAGVHIHLSPYDALSAPSAELVIELSD